MKSGINYVTNIAGERIAVQIDLRRHGDIWEDFFDVLTAKRRKDEPRESLETVRSILKKKKKLDA